VARIARPRGALDQRCCPRRRYSAKAECGAGSLSRPRRAESRRLIARPARSGPSPGQGLSSPHAHVGHRQHLHAPSMQTWAAAVARSHECRRGAERTAAAQAIAGRDVARVGRRAAARQVGTAPTAHARRRRCTHRRRRVRGVPCTCRRRHRGAEAAAARAQVPRLHRLEHGWRAVEPRRPARRARRALGPREALPKRGTSRETSPVTCSAAVKRATVAGAKGIPTDDGFRLHRQRSDVHASQDRIRPASSGPQVPSREAREAIFERQPPAAGDHHGPPSERSRARGRDPPSVPLGMEG